MHVSYSLQYSLKQKELLKSTHTGCFFYHLAPGNWCNFFVIEYSFMKLNIDHSAHGKIVIIKLSLDVVD